MGPGLESRKLRIPLEGHNVQLLAQDGPRAKKYEGQMFTDERIRQNAAAPSNGICQAGSSLSKLPPVFAVVFTLVLQSLRFHLLLYDIEHVREISCHGRGIVPRDGAAPNPFLFLVIIGIVPALLKVLASKRPVFEINDVSVVQLCRAFIYF